MLTISWFIHCLKKVAFWKNLYTLFFLSVIGYLGGHLEFVGRLVLPLKEKTESYHFGGYFSFFLLILLRAFSFPVQEVLISPAIHLNYTVTCSK